MWSWFVELFDEKTRSRIEERKRRHLEPTTCRNLDRKTLIDITGYTLVEINYLRMDWNYSTGIQHRISSRCLLDAPATNSKYSAWRTFTRRSNDSMADYASSIALWMRQFSKVKPYQGFDTLRGQSHDTDNITVRKNSSTAKEASKVFRRLKQAKRCRLAGWVNSCFNMPKDETSGIILASVSEGFQESQSGHLCNADFGSRISTAYHHETNGSQEEVLIWKKTNYLVCGCSIRDYSKDGEEPQNIQLDV